MPVRKRPAHEGLENLAHGRARAGAYLTDFERLLGLRAHRRFRETDRWTFEALMELRPRLLDELGDSIDLRKAFFVSAQSGVDTAVQAIAHYILLREAIRVSPEAAESVKDKLRGQARTYCKHFTGDDLVQAVSCLRLCNISPSDDRGSHRMRWLAAAFICLLHHELCAKHTETRLTLTGALITKACAFAVITGGRALCQLVRRKLTPDVLAQLPPWCRELLQQHENDKVWSTGSGRPRVALPAEDELEEGQDDDQICGAVDLLPEREAPGPGDASEGDGSSSLFAAMLCSQRDEMGFLGTRLLREAADEMLWTSASHCGFRPMRSAGFPRAIQMWEQYIARSPLSWRNRTLHVSSFMMPCMGLVHKVLRDRVEEMVKPYMDPAAFRRRFACVPIIPPVGGCARTLCLLQQRSMILGTDHCAVIHPPQLVLQWSRRLRTELRKEARRLGLTEPDVDLNHSVAEHLLCCFSKCVDFMLGLRHHHSCYRSYTGDGWLAARASSENLGDC